MLKTSAALAFACLAACGHGSDEVTIVTPPRVPDRIAPGVPHGAAIMHVAVTEQGDAALSIDSLDEIRLWPTLDGKRPPVPIAATGVVEAALGHAGEDLLVALLDQAGAVRLLRVGHDGTIHGRAQVPGEVACVQVLAIDGGVLVVRADESIEGYDAAGKPHGRIVPDAGERIGAIATRAGSAAALIAKQGDQDETGSGNPERARTLRWIVLSEDLHWGTSVPLGAPVFSSALALAPNHRRIGVIDFRSNKLDVLDLEPLPKSHQGPSIPATVASLIGFADDDHCALINAGVQWWVAQIPVEPDPDPWAVQTPSTPPALVPGGAGGAIGDGLAITGLGPALALVEPTEVKYLGWKTTSAGAVTAIGSRIAVAVSATRTMWLDDQLSVVDDTDVSTIPGGLAYAVWIDDHHALGDVTVDKHQVLLIDTDHLDHLTTIGTFSALGRLEYFREANQAAVVVDGEIRRYELDLAHRTAKELPMLKAPSTLQREWLLDPARADGIIAITTSTEVDGQHVQVFRKGTGKTIAPVKDTANEETVVDVDPSGTMYLSRGANKLVLRHEGRADLEVPTVQGLVGSHSHDNRLIAFHQGAGIVLVDEHGTTRWQRPVWGLTSTVFSPDDRRVVVQTAGGIVAFDTSTGERVASACGFEFGLQTSAPITTTLGVTPICEDAP